MTVYRKHESMNERSIGIKSRYTNFHNIDKKYDFNAQLEGTGSRSEMQ